MIPRWRFGLVCQPRSSENILRPTLPPRPAVLPPRFTSRRMRAALILATVAALTTAARAVAFFESQVRPVLAENCFSCHGPEKQKGGLRLDSRVAFLKGAGGEPVVVPGDPDRSILIKAIRHDG